MCTWGPAAAFTRRFENAAVSIISNKTRIPEKYSSSTTRDSIHELKIYRFINSLSSFDCSENNRTRTTSSGSSEASAHHRGEVRDALIRVAVAVCIAVVARRFVLLRTI